MHIKEIEIDNFKSLANKTTIPFLEGFTVISGPNGSGKSNILDSVLFALGLARANVLRGEQGVADLISTYNKRGEASVKVTFVADDNTEFSIKRHVKKGKSGIQSNYYYNDKPVTWAQVLLELEKYNVSPNSYNVIMQGDVTEITKCSAVERRKKIDEIAGTADFDRKIEAATDQIKSVEERVANANIIISELDIQLERLKEDREVALKYQKLKNEKTAYETQIQSAQYYDVVHALELVHQNILDNTKNKKELSENIKVTESKIKDTQIKYDKANDEVKAQGEEKQLEVKKMAEEKKGEIERKRLAITSAENTKIQNLKNIDSYNNGIESLNKKIGECSDSITNKTKELDSLNAKLKDEKKTHEKILKEMTGLDKSADEHIKRRNELKKQIDEIKDKETEILKEQLPLESDLRNNNEKIDSLNQEIDNLEVSVKTFADNKDKLELQIKQLETETADLKILFNKAFDELEKAKADKDDADSELERVTKRVVILEANKNAFKQTATGSAVETVLGAKIKGVYGTLSQLVDVEDEYVDAINVAMGARANSIVTDTQDTSWKAIQILKASGKRASFIPLDVVRKAPLRMALPKEKGVIDFAINLIDFDDKYIDAFYTALGETVIVEGEATVKKLAGKYRVVTLDGDISEKSGILTGGSTKKGSNPFEKSDERELEKHKKLANELSQKRQNLTEKIKEYENRLNDLRQKNSTATSALSSAKTELNLLITNNENSSEVIEAKKQNLKELKEANKKITRTLDSIEKESIKLNDDLLKIQDELGEVEKLIDDGALKELREKTQDIEGKIKETEKEIIAKEGEIQRDKDQITFNEKTIETRKNDIKTLEDSNITIKNDIEKFNSEISVLNEELDNLNKQVEELGKNIKELQQKRDDLSEELLTLKSDKNKLDSQLEQLKEQEEANKTRRKELDTMLEEIIKNFEEAGINYKELEKTDISLDEIKAKIARLEKRMEDLGPVNMRAIMDYDDVEHRHNEHKEKIDTLEKEKDEIKTRMTGYQNLRKETFLNAYHAINKNFKEVFEKISDGKGTLVLENEDDPFAGGLTIKANVRDKEKQKLASMSGGEKSLTALAFLFAIQKYMPSPFYALDEIDQNLDNPNVERIAKIIMEQSKTAQFIVISLRQPMLDNAERLIAVSQKEKGVTKILGGIKGNKLAEDEQHS